MTTSIHLFLHESLADTKNKETILDFLVIVKLLLQNYQKILMSPWHHVELSLQQVANLNFI